MAYNVIDIANKILARATDSEFDGLVCNMKLQKMLYYMQGFHLAYFDTPLFDEEIEAWMYGPVVPSVYDNFKINGNAGIEYTGDVITLSPEEEALFNEVYRVYSEFSAIGLMNRTHSESPWQSVDTGVGSIIPKETMHAFFKTRLQ
ncbi:DUF4065 domain-containing protein [Carboxylicivirga sp. A043]|uniref:Panacea domain-containing protein n=1 Tax=Carboxylicivirga litoralis TaxID=2816963 RepID=UPI0021CB5443|nr:type II toxin-antitoxin system antitoxin SocA domain-containing protein [Carboxylicivirga sp. A043]MCU4155224.1 DUF4065 domain-containing protein [Carboxylicivirga sp. A043]